MPGLRKGGEMASGTEIAEAPQEWSAVILGETASKANSRKIVVIRGKPAVIKSDKGRQFVASALFQLNRQQIAGSLKPLEGPVFVEMVIYYRTERPDLDESLVLDVLQGYAYRNDRQVRSKWITHAIDKENPRVVVNVTPIKKGGIYEARYHRRKIEGAREAS